MKEERAGRAIKGSRILSSKPMRRLSMVAVILQPILDLRYRAGEAGPNHGRFSRASTKLAAPNRKSTVSSDCWGR